MLKIKSCQTTHIVFSIPLRDLCVRWSFWEVLFWRKELSAILAWADIPLLTIRLLISRMSNVKLLRYGKLARYAPKDSVARDA